MGVIRCPECKELEGLDEMFAEFGGGVWMNHRETLTQLQKDIWEHYGITNRGIQPDDLR